MVVDSTEATGVMDIYAAAGLERPRLDALTPAWMEEAAAPSKAELAIEGLRTDLLKEATRVTGGNEIRRAQFSERINAVMAKYTNQQLTAAEVIADPRVRGVSLTGSERAGAAVALIGFVAGFLF